MLTSLAIPQGGRMYYSPQPDGPWTEIPSGQVTLEAIKPTPLPTPDNRANLNLSGEFSYRFMVKAPRLTKRQQKALSSFWGHH